MRDFLTTIDQMGREVTFSYPPKRIVSLVPSQTELLVDIGAPLVGRTKFCVHPIEMIKEIEVIGGTKNFRFEKIKALNPDLIIGNKEENYKEGIVELAKDFPVWMSDIYTLEDAFSMMKSLGHICYKSSEADKILALCQQAIEEVKTSKKGKVIYLIWKNPWMAAGRNTFIDHIISHLGYENLITQDRYPELQEAEIDELNPEVILLSSEPFPFKEKHLEEVASRWPKAQIKLVDGELYSWYGSRMKHWN